METNNKKIINAWCFYDWANSAYSLVITSTIFPVYYNAVTKSAFHGTQVRFFDFPIENTVLYSYAISFSYLIIALLSPMLSGIADYGGRKRMFMRFFSTLGAAACITLFFFKGENIELGIFAFGLATIGYAGGLVFYNAFLPEITTPDKYDSVSARGYAFGYIGSVILLVINLFVIMKYQLFGLVSEETATRLAFLMVGVWWIGFSLITFRYVKDATTRKGIWTSDIIMKGFHELQTVAKDVLKQQNIKRFLVSFFCYSTGVQTAMFLAATFAEKELHMEGPELILVILILQLVAILGAYLTAQLSKQKGNKFSLMIMLIIWTALCFFTFFIQTKAEFYFVAIIIGLVMGGIQSLSRATYAKLLPEEVKDPTSYFSFYDLLEKLAIVVGTFSYGYIEMITGTMRNSILALGVFFVLGAVLMLRTRIARDLAK